jgi:hypothetical protein
MPSLSRLGGLTNAATDQPATVDPEPVAEPEPAPEPEVAAEPEPAPGPVAAAGASAAAFDASVTVDEPEPDGLARPALNASREAWADYWVALGYDPGDRGRDELRDLMVDGEGDEAGGGE